MTRHVGATALARYHEGDFGSRKSARIRAHLAACPRCAALDTDLAGVTMLLARAPAPAMPDQVTTRIQAALRAEATGAPAGAPAGPGTTPRSAEAAQHRRSRHAAGKPARWRRWRLPDLRSQVGRRALGAAAAAVVIAGSVYGLAQLASAGQPALSSGAATGAGSAGAEQNGPVQLSGPSVQYRRAGQPASFTPVSTNTNFRQRQLASQVKSALLRSGSNLPASAGANAASPPRPQSRHASGGKQSFAGIAVKALQGCVMRVSAGRKVLLVDVDRYQGRPATVIVLAGPGGGTSGAQIFVVGPGCSASDSDLITQASLPGGG